MYDPLFPLNYLVILIGLGTLFIGTVAVLAAGARLLWIRQWAVAVLTPTVSTLLAAFLLVFPLVWPYFETGLYRLFSPGWAWLYPWPMFYVPMGTAMIWGAVGFAQLSLAVGLVLVKRPAVPAPDPDVERTDPAIRALAA